MKALRFANGLGYTFAAVSHAPHILSFSDYRAYLNAHFQITKRRNRRWSYGSWAKQLRLSSTSSLTKVLHGQREAGKDITSKFIHYFDFNRQEAHYFQDLVQLSKLKDDTRMAVLLMEKMEKKHPDGAIRILTDDEFKLISDWYPFAVRQLVKRKRFVESPNWIAQQFRFPLTATEAQHALNLLLRLGLLKRDERGRLRHAARSLDTTNDIASEALKRHHEQTFLQTAHAIRSIPMEERSVANTVFLMKSENLARAKEYLRKAREEFTKLFEDDEGDAVFRVQMQLLPLTKFYSRKETIDA